MNSTSIPDQQRDPIAGPRGHWLLGNLRAFRRDMLGFYEHCARQGDMVRYRLAHRWVCLASHPDSVEQVLTTASKHFTKRTHVLRLLIPTLGNGLLTSEGEVWLRQRRLMQPAFQRQQIGGHGACMVEYTLRMLERWQDGERLDLHEEMMRLTMEIVGKTLFDADVGGAARDVGEALAVVIDNFVKRWDSVWPLPVGVPTPGNLRFNRSIRKLDEIVYRMIAERRAQPSGRSDLLSLLLAARDEEDGSGMSDRQLRDEAMTLFLAGHDTTANALSWTWYLLMCHPEAEAELHEELARTLGGRAPTVADLPQLGFAERVVRESMRLYPPAYAFGRLALSDCEVGGRAIRRGTTVVLCPWVTHRDGRWFDDPLAFRPQRWTAEMQRSLPRFAYFPFGGGQRQCIGNHFAMMEATLVLATMAQRYQFRLGESAVVKPRPIVTLRPDGGIAVVLKKRK